MTVSLVTGVAGFIGSHVADELLRMGHTVIGIDDMSGGDPQNIPDGVTFYCRSITERRAIREIVARHRPEYVYHLAAYAAEGLSPFIRAFNYQNNVVGSATLISACLGSAVQRFVFTSSIAVYGYNDEPGWIFDETDDPHPQDPYGIAKWAVEQDLHAAWATHGLGYTIFRPHNVYGERQNVNDPYRNVVGIFLRQSLAGEPMTIFGDGRQTRAFSYIGDVAPAIARCVTLPHTNRETYNIGGSTPYSVLDLARAVSDAVETPFKVTHLPARREAIHARANHDKATRHLGLERPIPLSEGLARMAAWVKQLGPGTPTPCPSEIEVTDGLPECWKEKVLA